MCVASIWISELIPREICDYLSTNPNVLLKKAPSDKAIGQSECRFCCFATLTRLNERLDVLRSHLISVDLKCHEPVSPRNLNDVITSAVRDHFEEWLALPYPELASQVPAHYGVQLVQRLFGTVRLLDDQTE